MTAGGPPDIVATDGARVAVIDPLTGSAVRTLCTAGFTPHSPSGTGSSSTPQMAVTGLTVSPDRSRIYIALDDSCTGEVVSVPMNGGPVLKVSPGFLPGPSPDGTSIAVAEQTSACSLSSVPYRYQVSVVPLSGGAATVIPMNTASDPLPDVPASLSWSPDGSTSPSRSRPSRRVTTRPLSPE